MSVMQSLADMLVSLFGCLRPSVVWSVGLSVDLVVVLVVLGPYESVQASFAFAGAQRNV